MKRLLLIAPALLACLIFVNQVRMSFTGTLNPWKGGGFGMFSTIDASSMRVLKCEGIDQNGDTLAVRISLSGIYGEEYLERDILTKLQSKPTENQLRRIAGVLIRSTYVETGYQSRLMFEKLNKDYPYVTKKKYYRPLKKTDEITDKTVLKKLTSLQLSVLRMKMNPENNSLYYEPMLGPITIKND